MKRLIFLVPFLFLLALVPVGHAAATTPPRLSVTLSDTAFVLNRHESTLFTATVAPNDVAVSIGASVPLSCLTPRTLPIGRGLGRLWSLSLDGRRSSTCGLHHGHNTVTLTFSATGYAPYQTYVDVKIR